MMAIEKAEHDKLFDEICSKLKELSQKPETDMENSDTQHVVHNQKFEKMQSQIRRFHTDLENVQDNLMEKIKGIESLQHHQVDLHQQLRLMTDQLQSERQVSVKLNADLSKSLEINLQLQLELQNSRARFQQYQIDEKKYSNTILEKSQILQRDLELVSAEKDELRMELSKARHQWENLESKLTDQLENKSYREAELEKENIEFRKQNSDLNAEMEKMADSLNEFDEYRKKQNDALKNLMDAAEKKIVDYKMALDKKTLEAQDYYSHLQQCMTQMGLLKNENSQLRDYIQRLNANFQQQQNQQQQQK